MLQRSIVGASKRIGPSRTAENCRLTSRSDGEAATGVRCGWVIGGASSFVIFWIVVSNVDSILLS